MTRAFQIMMCDAVYVDSGPNPGCPRYSLDEAVVSERLLCGRFWLTDDREEKTKAAAAVMIVAE